MIGDSYEFVVNGRSYRAGKMDAVKQWHVVRRLSPLIGSLAGLMTTAKDLRSGKISAGANEALEIAGKALASLSDADSDFVMAACLASCERQTEDGKGWVRIWNLQASRLQFHDINMAEMLQICIEVLKDNVSSFFPEARSLSSGGPET